MAPVVNLSRAEFAQTGEEATQAPADSHGAMADMNPKILDALGVAKDADEAAVLSAITELKAEPKTLEAQAAEAGKVLLSKSEADTLKSKADRVDTLAEQVKTLAAERAEEKFSAAFDKARSEGRVDAKDETRELHRGIYDADPERSLTLLASLPRIVNTTAQGTGGHEGEPVVSKLDGYAVDPDKQVLLQRAEAYKAEHNVDMRTAILAVQEA
jgi:hypothetical protein